MSRLWKQLGAMGFWVGLPALYLYLRLGTRSKVLVVCGEQVLVVKSWLGAGKWALPGGGVHRGENPLSAAVRELKEETGIILPAEPQFMFKDIYKQHGLRFTYRCYVAELSETIPLKKRWPEISDAKWLTRAEITPVNAGPDVCKAIAAYFKGEKQQ